MPRRTEQVPQRCIDSRSPRLLLARTGANGLVWLLLLVLGVATAAHAQDPASDSATENPPQAETLDGLLEGLDLQAPAADPPAPQSPPQPPNGQSPNGQSPNGQRLGTQLREGTTASTGPLLEAYHSMRTARSLLAQGDTGPATQTAQRRVVELLDEMIAAAEQPDGGQPQSGAGPQSGQQPEQPGQQQMTQQQSGSGEPGQAEEQQSAGGQEAGQGGADQANDQADGQPASEAGGDGQPSGQAGAAVAAAGAGGAAGPRADRSEASVWGHLPERTRGMLRSEMPTEYLPQYSEAISEYFRTLAEMRPDE